MLGLSDELTNWLSQVNLYSGNKGLLDNEEFTKLSELFSATAWSRQIGEPINITIFLTNNSCFLTITMFFKCRCAGVLVQTNDD